MKIKETVIVLGILVVLISCASQPGNLGVHNPGNYPIEDLVTLQIAYNVSVLKVDNDLVNWSTGKYGTKVVQIPSGVHVFYVLYDSGSFYSLALTPVMGQFENGNSYLLKPVITREKSKQKVDYSILLFNNGKEGESVTFDLNKLKGNDPSVISKYIKYIENPKMDNVGNSVKLENDQYVLTYKPDLVYTLTNKETGIMTEGRAGFIMNFLMTAGKAYLVETDLSAMSSDEFLKSKYTENAQMILVPIECSETELTYSYERPVELQGTTITFGITEN